MRAFKLSTLRAVVGILAATAPQCFLHAATNAPRFPPSQQAAAQNVNHLGDQNSPYLLEHANDLVDWYPWGTEAFTRAQHENKLIFLSIGYSSCHWCHVMQKEDFQDPAIASLMNRYFVAVLVDREERPDIDRQYMAACVMLTGSGGWPLNILMTPDRNPFFASVYIPKNSTPGALGMLDLIPKVQQEWEKDPKGILKNAAKITIRVAQGLTHDAPGNDLRESSLKSAYEALAAAFDSRTGGFGGAPKFPPYLDMGFLLRYWKRTQDPKALGMVEKTLDALTDGAIYDQLGYGFHRYTLDAEWRKPHFEKMLYDQAEAAEVFLDTYRATGQQRYSQAARNIFEYVARELTSLEGAFYDAQDADSEGTEGKFYLWTEQQIREAVNAADTDVVIRAFGITSKGNFPSAGKGENCIYRKEPLTLLAANLNLPEATVNAEVESARQTLFAAREKRVHPARDEKVTTGWNGLMIAALAKGAQVFSDKRYEQTAQRAADFILTHLTGPQRASSHHLLHSYFAHEASVPANLDDYAYLIQGLLDLYETNFQIRNLQAALDLNQELVQNLWDPDQGGFFYSSNAGQDTVLTREKSCDDGDLPSGNAVAELNLLRLAAMTGDQGLEQRAIQLEKAFSGAVEKSPARFPALLLAADFRLGPIYEVVIAGNAHSPETEMMLDRLGAAFIPNKVVLLRPTDERAPEILRIAEFTRFQTAIDGRATAYVCLQYHCKLPTTDVGTMLEMLGVNSSEGGRSSR